MKKPVYFIAFISIILSLSFISCGPGKKLISSRAKVENLLIDSINTHDQLNECHQMVKNLKDEKATLQDNNSSLKYENESVNNDLKTLSTQSKMTIAEHAKRLKSLHEMIQSQKDRMDHLKNSIADALMNY